MENTLKDFFNTFNIKDQYWCSYTGDVCPHNWAGKGVFRQECPMQSVPVECSTRSKEAMCPKITDKMWLKLVCVFNDSCNRPLYSTEVDELKEELILNLIGLADIIICEDGENIMETDLYKKVRAVFGLTGDNTNE